MSAFRPGPSASLIEADRAMRAALVESLRHIRAAGIVPANGIDPEGPSGLSRILAHRVGPGVFGRYYDLVFAVQAKRHDEARALFGEILDHAAHAPDLTVLPYTEAALGRDRDRFGRLLDLSADEPALLAPPGPGEWDGFERNVAAALAQIEEADADLAAELRALIVLIVGAVPPEKAAGRGFGGASSFMLWGAVFLNIQRHATPLDIVDGLVHEAAHQLLFAFSRDDALVENAVGERFASPLRKDPRPMIGVYHATFVCARVHYVFDRLRTVSPATLAAAELDRMNDRLGHQRRAFGDGYDTIRRHARLTARGERIIEDAAAYMAEHERAGR